MIDKDIHTISTAIVICVVVTVLYISIKVFGIFALIGWAIGLCCCFPHKKRR